MPESPKKLIASMERVFRTQDPLVDERPLSIAQGRTVIQGFAEIAYIMGRLDENRALTGRKGTGRELDASDYAYDGDAAYEIAELIARGARKKRR